MNTCCVKPTLTVIGNNALATPSASPVTLNVDRPLTDMPARGIFTLRIPTAILKNANPNPVQLADGTNTLALIGSCTDPLRYDSLIASAALSPCPAILSVTCSRRSEPAPGHVACLEPLPASSYAAPATAAAPTSEAAEGAV